MVVLPVNTSIITVYYQTLKRLIKSSRAEARVNLVYDAHSMGYTL